MFVRWYGTYFVFNVFALYIDLVCKHGVVPRKIAVKCNPHHHQGVIVPSAKTVCI